LNTRSHEIKGKGKKKCPRKKRNKGFSDPLRIWARTERYREKKRSNEEPRGDFSINTEESAIRGGEGNRRGRRNDKEVRLASRIGGQNQ